MPPSIAALVFVVGIAGLYYFDRGYNRDKTTSWALWLPIFWLILAGSRMVSQWLSLSGGIALGTQDQYLEGSPLDRYLFTLMLVVGLGILIARGRRTAAVLRENVPLILFFLYCLASVLWSDYPFVSFKRWTKGLGNVAMVLIVLTDPNPRLAMKRFIASAGFILIPVSVLFIKYYPDYGRGYLAWVWTPVYTGVANDKNGLGYDCLLFGLGALWCFLEAVREKAGRYRNRQLLAHGTILLMAAWLFWKANSATSMIGFLLGATILLLVTLIRRPVVVHVLAVAIPLAAVIAFVILDLDAYAASAVGRDVSLTGRTELWAEALRIHNAPWFGVGFETYWLGPRADYLWAKFWWRPNQAHNGYLETYLTLGWMGLVMLAAMLASGYRHIVQILRRDPDVASFLVGLFAATLVYNLTEAAFKGIHPLWIATLFTVATVPTLPLGEIAQAGPPQPVRSGLTVLNTEWASARSRSTDGEKTARLPGVRARTSH